ncbi:MAG: YifB family Mg chelatase-like AAA ATPase [Nitrospirales bacterium]
MLAKVHSLGLVGLEANPIEIEVDLGGGLPQFSIVGLPDATVRESRDRVRSALKNTGFRFPPKKITVNLAPAGIKKEGAGLELGIAIGILIAEGVLTQESVAPYLFVGELALDGRIKEVPGALSMAMATHAPQALILPHANALQASVVDHATIYGVHTLPQVVEFLQGSLSLPPVISDPKSFYQQSPSIDNDFADVVGQFQAKRALEVAAAGGHNLLMVGPPGSGKTMLAQRLSGILPPMSFQECLEASQVHSVAGSLPTTSPLLTDRPFRAPHHTISEAGLVGGGSIPRPGEVSLAHHGVLFLDEALEFKRVLLDSLRQPLENGTVTLTRVQASLTYPAKLMLVVAMNPCPCGYSGDPTHECVCTPYHIQRYRSRLSGPLLDRLDIHIEVPAVPVKELSGTTNGEASSRIRHRVIQARHRQIERYRDEHTLNNAQLKPRLLKKYCQLDAAGKTLLDQAVSRLGLSARAYGRILRVSRTIADLGQAETIQANHVAEAIQYRALDRPLSP